MIRKIYIITTLLFSFSTILIAENTYPVSYKLKSVEESGKLLIHQVDEQIFNYLIKPSLSGESEVVEMWKGKHKSKIRGTSIGEINILASFLNDGILFLIYEENTKLYISCLDTLLNTIAVTGIHFEQEYSGKYQINWTSLGIGKIAILLNNHLFFIDYVDKFLHIRFISSDVSAISTSFDNKNNEFYYLKRFSNIVELVLLSSGFNEKVITRLQLTNDVFLQMSGNYIYIISGNRFSNYSWIHVCSKDRGFIEKFSIKSHPHLIKARFQNGLNFLDYLVFDNTNYTFVRKNITDKTNASYFQILLPDGLIESREIFNVNDTNIILFRNGLVSISDDGDIISMDYFPFGEYFSDVPELFRIDNDLYLSSYSLSLMLNRTDNAIWFINKFLNEGGKYVFSVLLILVILLLYRKFSIQRNLSNALLDLPSAGIVFIIDTNGRLRKLNESGKKMLGITEDVPMRRIFKYYCDIDRNQQLQLLVDKVIALRTGFTQRINIFEGNSVKEWFITIFPLRSRIGKIKGYVITGLDITEELERRRINNLAQLAHDMQTNLSTIRLNAEQLECDSSSDNSTRRKKIIHQVTLLIQRVRDIVTVGRSDNPDWQFIDASDICVEVRNEFDDSMFPNIEFKLEIKVFTIKCDKQKLIRALRNAVENGIRAIGNNQGQITISNWNDVRFSYFSIKDTGTGMDEIRKKKMMTPYFSTSNKEGGSGIGTLIMQSVMEQHGGEFRVISEPNKGCEILFCIPNIERSKGL